MSAARSWASPLRCLPILAAQHNPRLAVAGVLLVWPFVFDAAFTFLRRLRHRENVFAAHRSNLCCANGWSLPGIAIAVLLPFSPSPLSPLSPSPLSPSPLLPFSPSPLLLFSPSPVRTAAVACALVSAGV